jgi:hypothetical protein
MKKSRKIFIILSLFIPTYGFCYSWPVDPSSTLIDTFGKTYPHNKNLFLKGLIFTTPAQKTEIRSVQDGKVIFSFQEGNLILPSSFGLSDILVLKNKKARQFYYSHIKMTSLLKSINQNVIIKQGTLLGNTTSFEGEKAHSFLFSIKEKKAFLQPIKYFSLEKNQTPELILEGIWIKAGIFQKVININHNNSLVILPLRESFDIYTRAYEKFHSSQEEQNPNKIEITIKEKESPLIVYHKLVYYNNIIDNKINGVYAPSQIYKKRWLKNYIYSGTWEKKERMKTYIITTEVTDYNGEIKLFSVLVAFR